MIATVLGLMAVGALLGAIGARTNRVRTGDEVTLWMAAGAVGAPLAVAEWALILWGVNGLTGAETPLVPAAVSILVGGGLLGAAVTPALDNSDTRALWIVSLAVKWLRSPLATTAGLLAALVVRVRGRLVDFQRGMLFIQVGPGGSALALGGVGWCQERCFRRDRCLSDGLARHEAVHSRTVAAVGEFGFYLTYLTAGALWARHQGGPWNSLTTEGCGQPFEKTAHTFTKDPAVAVPCRGRSAVASSQPPD